MFLIDGAADELEIVKGRLVTRPARAQIVDERSHGRHRGGRRHLFLGAPDLLPQPGEVEQLHIRLFTPSGVPAASGSPWAPSSGLPARCARGRARLSDIRSRYRT